MAWVDVANFVEQEINSADYPARTARVVCELWSADGLAAQARLYDQTNGVSVGESAVITSTTATDATFAVTLTPGVSRYRLQVTGTVGVDLFCRSAGVMV